MIRRAVTEHRRGNSPRTVTVRGHLIGVCEKFVDSGLADPKFVSELASGDEQKFWFCILRLTRSFPIGPVESRTDRQTLKAVVRGHQHRPYVLNRNGAQVPAYTFLDPCFESISAIWAVDLNGGSAIGNSEPTAVIHNPNARNPLPVGFLPADDEYFAHQEGDEYVLQKVAV